MTENKETAQFQAVLLSIQEAAKQICTIVPIVQTAYFAAVSLGDLKTAVWQDWQRLWWVPIPFMLPALLWLASLLSAIQVFVPPTVGEGGSTSAAYNHIIKTRYRQLKRSLFLAAGGLLAMIVAAAVYLVCIPPPPPSAP